MACFGIYFIGIYAIVTNISLIPLINDLKVGDKLIYVKSYLNYTLPPPYSEIEMLSALKMSGCCSECNEQFPLF